MSETTTCPSCRSSHANSTGKDYLCKGVNYKLQHCSNCDLQFWEPRETVPEIYFEKSNLTADVGLQRLRMWHYSFFKIFPSRGGRLLDVGCEDGAFLSAAEKTGFEITGCDFDQAAIKAGIKVRAIDNLFPHSLQEFAEKGSKFDIITFFEVLEHQDEPALFIEDVKKLLSKNGWIAGSVPNRNRYFIKREPQDYPPVHFIYFSESSLRYLLEKKGFSNIKICSNNFRTKDLGIYLETQVLNIWGSSLKKNIKKKALGVSDAAALSLSIENLPKKQKSLYTILKVLKHLRNIIFYLPALLLKPFLRPHLYFQAQRLDES